MKRSQCRCGCGTVLVHTRRDRAVTLGPDERWHYSRGLSAACHSRIVRAGGRLDDYPPGRHDAREVAQRWEAARARGVRRREFAAEVGISMTALDKAITRGKRAAPAQPVTWLRSVPTRSFPRVLFDPCTLDEGEEAP